MSWSASGHAWVTLELPVADDPAAEPDELVCLRCLSPRSAAALLCSGPDEGGELKAQAGSVSGHEWAARRDPRWLEQRVVQTICSRCRQIRAEADLTCPAEKLPLPAMEPMLVADLPIPGSRGIPEEVALPRPAGPTVGEP